MGHNNIKNYLIRCLVGLKNFSVWLNPSKRRSYADYPLFCQHNRHNSLQLPIIHNTATIYAQISAIL